MSEHPETFYQALGYRPVAASELPKALGECHEGRFEVAEYGPLQVVGKPCHGCLLLVHGAGAGHTSAFMQAQMKALCRAGIQVWAIDLPYMQTMQKEGKRRPPPPVSHSLAQLQAWFALLEPLTAKPLVVGGKSMGGRVATMLAARQQCHGVVVFGYPFHPARSPEKRRVAHLAEIVCPVLIIQGERDPLGRADEVTGYGLEPPIEVAWLHDGDHDFKPRRLSGLNQQVLIDEAGQLAASFVRAQGTPEADEQRAGLNNQV